MSFTQQSLDSDYCGVVNKSLSGDVEFKSSGWWGRREGKGRIHETLFHTSAMRYKVERDLKEDNY